MGYYIGDNAGRCSMRQWCIVHTGRWWWGVILYWAGGFEVMKGLTWQNYISNKDILPGIAFFMLKGMLISQPTDLTVV